MVFYLKYRPQTFEELDIEVARERLKKIFSSGRIPHAFLFSGPKGTGKTSAARIVAKVVNCERLGRGRNFSSPLTARSPETDSLIADGEKSAPSPRSSGNKAKSLLRGDPESASQRRKDSLDGGTEQRSCEPCNQCETCQAITRGTCLDVLEIDGASNRGIDEIRKLRERIKLAPSSARYKVYIIDEVHMLTGPAFNALLKTLEEPPEHAIFILATTQPHKLPDTIKSRCVPIDFRKATDKEIARSLRRIVKGEDLKVEDGVLEFIAQNAGGSFRDATKILEEASLSGKLLLEEARKVLGKEKEFGEKDFLGWLIEKDAKKALFWLADAGQRGVDYKFLTQELLETLHKELVGRFKEEKPAYKKLDVAQIKKLIALFSKVHQELRTTTIPSLPLELAIVEWCESEPREKA